MVAEIRSTGGASGTTTYLLTGLAIDEVLARYTGADVRTYFTDALGNVLALAKDDQSIATTYGYSPYGETTTSGEASANDSQYTARENDGTGLYYYRARYYDPVLKRFIAEDPIGLGGGINAYAYVGGDPVSFVDPSGYCQVAVWMGGYIMGWRPCDEPPKPQPPSDPNCPPEPPAPPTPYNPDIPLADIPTEQVEYTSGSCVANCVIDNALKLLGKEIIVSALEGKAKGVAKSGLKLFSAAGVGIGAYEIASCPRICTRTTIRIK